MFTKNRNFKIKCKIDGKINLYSRYTDFSFKMFETINDIELSNLQRQQLEEKWSHQTAVSKNLVDY